MKILTLASANVSRDGSIISTDASSSRFILFIIKLYILLLLVTGYADVLERHLLSNKYMAIAQLQMLLLCILALSFMFTHYVSILRRRLMQTMTQLKLQQETEGNVSARHVRGFNLSLVGTWLLVVFFVAIEASMTAFYVRQVCYIYAALITRMYCQMLLMVLGGGGLQLYVFEIAIIYAF